MGLVARYARILATRAVVFTAAVLVLMAVLVVLG